MESRTQSKNPVDILTLAVISASAYLLAVALHELVGHGLACVMVHGQVLGLGAFSVNCGFTGLSDLVIRWVVFAGPLVSLLIGVVAFLLLPTLPPNSHVFCFVNVLKTDHIGTHMFTSFGNSLIIVMAHIRFHGVCGKGADVLE